MKSEYSNEQFLKSLELAVISEDRYEMSRLEKHAFEVKNVAWQKAARHADNYLVFLKRGDEEMQNQSKLAFQSIVAKILK